MPINGKSAKRLKTSETSGKKGLGIKGRLMLSFGLVALTTVLAGGISILSYDSIESASTKMTGESVLAMSKAFEMVEEATALRSLALTMAGASDRAEYTAVTDQFASHREDIDDVLEAIAETNIPSAKINVIDTEKSDLFNALGDLSNRVDERLEAAVRRNDVMAEIAEDHGQLADWLVLQIDDAGFELVIETENSTEGLSGQIETLMTDGVDRLQSALTLRAEVNLVAGILIEAAAAPDQGALAAIEDRFQAARANVDEQLATLGDEGAFAELAELTENLVELGDGPDGIFAARRAFFSNDAEGPSETVSTWTRRIYGPREDILRTLEPIVDEASFDLVIFSEAAIADNAKVINRLIDHSVGNLQGLLGIAADSNWLAGLLHQASMEHDRAALRPLIEQIDTGIEHLNVYKDMLRLPDAAQQELEALLQPLLERAAGSETVVDIRTAELEIWSQQEAAVKRTSDLADMLTQSVNEVVEFAYVDVQESSDAVQTAIENGRWLLIVLSLASLGIAVAIVAFYVGPNIVAPLSKISRSVGRLANGEQVDVPGMERNDELGELARSLGVIHDQAIEASRIKLALDSADSPVMVTDAAHKVIYVNACLRDLFAMAESDIRIDMPTFSASELVGGTLDFVYQLSGDFKTAIGRLDRPHHEALTIGSRHLSFVASPVRGADGIRLGSVLQWQDETEERQLRQAIGSVVDAASAGDFSKRIEAAGIEGTMADLAGGINHLAALVDGATTDLGQMLASLAQGDLSSRIHNEYQGALGELKDNANRTADQLSDIVAQIQVATSEVSNAATEISSGTSDLSERTERAASSLEETAASSEQLAATVNQNARHAANASELAGTADRSAKSGGQVVEQAVSAMSVIEASAQKITDIIGVIDEIAFQTNLLALNASVEAARAGEAGKGFAVVAQEVRQLAQRAAQAASDIKGLIEDSNGQVKEGVELVNRAGHSLTEIVGSIGKVAGIVDEISKASQEQSSGVQEINSSIVGMDEMTQQNSALVEESTAAARALSDQAAKVNELMSFFKLDGVGMSDRQDQAPPKTVEKTLVPAGGEDGWSEF